LFRSPAPSMKSRTEPIRIPRDRVWFGSGLLFFPLVALLLAHPYAVQAQTAAVPITDILASLQRQDFEQALRLCTAALEKSPGDPRIWTLRGMAYAGEGVPSSALDAYQHALKVDARYLPALEGAAQMEYQRKSAAARSLIERVLAQAPDDATSHTMLGYLDYAAKDCKAAIPHFERGGDVLAQQPRALAAYGSCLADSDQYAKAIPVFQQALNLDASLAGVQFNLALSQWKAGETQAALATLKPVVERDHAGEPLLLAADIYESTNDTPHAIELLRKAMLDDPKNVEAYIDFASLSYDHASSQVGIDVIDAGLTQLPQEPRLYLVRGVLFAQLGKFEESSQDFETANRLDPHLSLLGTAEGLVASQQHRSKQALNSFRAAVNAQPKDALTQYLLAEALSQESPEQGSAEYAEEIAAAKRAFTLDPKMVAARDLLATIYLQDGLTDLAVEQSRAALAVDPKDQQALFHLILAMRRSGEKEEVASLSKQLALLRSRAQAEMAQNKRYQLQEVQEEK
jgi:tetratricopeptide (TPR) repeat protein